MILLLIIFTVVTFILTIIIITRKTMDYNIDELYALMGNVIDGHNGENLYAYLAKFNHLNVGYVADAKSAREKVPQIYRKNGFYLTYYISTKPTTEMYVGTNDDAAVEDNWTNDANWEFCDGIGKVDTNSITLEQLSEEVRNLLAQGDVNIVNYPDGEDLTQVDACNGQGKHEINVLKFKDKEYNPVNFSGYGRKFLRKNLVDGNNILTQEMINEPNTRYIIQYDYDLNSKIIIIPANAVLVFEGGSLKNGTINCNNTIIATWKKELLNVTVAGTYFYYGWNADSGTVDIVNNLTTNDPNKALSAAQGVVLKQMIDNLSTKVPTEKPDNPQLGDLWYDVTNNVLKYWNGTEWVTVGGIQTEQPDNPEVGDIYYDTTENVFKYWNGTTWITIGGSGSGGGGDLDGAQVLQTTTLESGQSATATAVLQNGMINFTFGIPKGDKGDKGDPGDKGDKGDTGDPGQPGSLPDYTIYRYCKSDSKPAAPVGTSQNPSGWTDIPNDTGNWWQVQGIVDGATGAVTQWGEVIPLNGRDGTAQDGRYTEMRFAVNTSRTGYPLINRTVRTPSGWTLNAPTVSEGYYLWMTTAIINPDDTLYTNWNIPVCISGPQGETGGPGPAGDIGPSGNPGVSIDVVYCAGGPTAPQYEKPVGDDLNGWSETIAEADYDSSDDPDWSIAYLWGCQGKRTYTSSTDYTIEWGEPFRMTSRDGDNGLDGTGYTIYVTPPVVNLQPTSTESQAALFRVVLRNNGNAIPYAGSSGTAVDAEQFVMSVPRKVGGGSYPSSWRFNFAAPGTTLGQTYYDEFTYIFSIPAGTEVEDTELTATCTIYSRYNSSNLEDRVVKTIIPIYFSVSTKGAGKKGQIIYPAGIYNLTTAYTTDNEKAPYVLDTTDNCYYVLNAIMTWRGTEHDNLTPSQDYAINDGKYWLKFDMFQAIFTQIGIIANGLIGNAVFNGDWMFSQQGKNALGAATNAYENFNSDNPFADNNIFKPNIAINFLTGEVYFGCNKIRFGADGYASFGGGNSEFNANGSGQLAGGNITWDSDGNVSVNSITTPIQDGGTSPYSIRLPKVEIGSVKTDYYARFLDSTVNSANLNIVAQVQDDRIIYREYNSDFTSATTKVVSDSATIKLRSGFNLVKFTGFRYSQYEEILGSDSNNNNGCLWFVEHYWFGGHNTTNFDINGILMN